MSGTKYDRSIESYPPVVRSFWLAHSSPNPETLQSDWARFPLPELYFRALDTRLVGADVLLWVILEVCSVEATQRDPLS